MSTRLKLILFLVIIVVPFLLALTTAQVSFSKAKSVEFCGSCHVMTPWIENVTGEDSDSLAAEHYKRRWIQHDQCFTCHSNYDFLGPLQAKIKGLRHVIAYYTGVPEKIELYDEFPNANCLQCHVDARGFLEDSNHEPIEDILSGKDRCVECHEMVHGVEQGAVEDESEEESAEDSENDKAENDKAENDKAENDKAEDDKADEKPEKADGEAGKAATDGSGDGEAK
ncbi:MAG: NapC/NirT family cytochrome c [Candidatus Binatia bacterium]